MSNEHDKNERDGGEERSAGDASTGGSESASSPEPTPRIDAGSIYDVHEEHEPCPSCGVELDADAVVCIECGYDMRQARHLTPETGHDVVEEPKEVPALVSEGRGGAKVWLIVGGALVVGAMVGAGVGASQAEAGFGAITARVLLTGYLAVLHGATGLGALFIVARAMGMTFSDSKHHAHGVDLGAARMLVGVGLFLLLMSLVFPWGGLGQALKLLLACGAYFLVLWGLFGRSAMHTALIACVHAVLAAFLWIGSWLSAMAL